MIPLALTQITVSRLPQGTLVDGYDELPPPAVTVVSGIRATIGSPTSRTSLTDGTRVVTSWTMQADVCDIQAGDTVVDGDGNTYFVSNAVTRKAFGLDHVRVVLTDVQGA